jgi:sortase B
MSFYKKPFFLNSLLGIAILTLSITAFLQWRRSETESLYRAMAEINASQRPVSETASTRPAEPGQDVPSQSGLYTYIENQSRQWLDINPDYLGWIRISGTNIDYPFVRSRDNQDYLKKDFNLNTSEAGTLFMDYRNLGNFNDLHAIIYGHNMKNKTMFQNLTLFRQAGFFKDHPWIEISGLYETKTYQVFSVYEVSADDYAFTLDFKDQEYGDYLTGLQRLSLHPSGIELNPELQLLTLATCSYGVDNGRFVVHALEVKTN